MGMLHALGRRLDGFVRSLGTRRAGWWTLAVATLLAATSIGPHRALDDYVIGLIAQGRGAPVGLSRAPLDSFTFTTGSPDGNHGLMDVGLMLPWWTDEHLKISFFRPVSSVTHWIDERLWPNSAVLMHLQSLAWFAALLGAVGLVYRKLEASPALAGFGFLLYAIDDAHGATVAWLANRNAIIAALFGCLALVLHDAGRRGKNRIAAVLAPVALVVGLLAGELAIGVVGYLVAYAFLVDRDGRARRLGSLAPYAAVIVGWRMLWSANGFGARGSGAYLDPLADPGGFVGALPAKLAVLFHGQFSAPPSDLAFLAPPAHRPFLVALAMVTVLVVVWLLAPILRRDKTSRFWAVGMALSLLPLGATFPSDRLLLFVGIGAMALLARLFMSWVAALSDGSLGLDARALLTAGLVMVHLVVAPLLLPVRSAQMEIFGVAHDRAAREIPADPSIRGRTVVIIAAPTLLFANYIQAERELAGTARPAHLYVLASASSPIEVERTGPDSLTLRPAHGFLYTPLEQHYRGVPDMEVGERVVLSAMTAEVVSRSGDGRPAAVEFSFREPRSSYLFLKWERGRYVPFTLPEEGKSVTLPEEDFGKILADTAMGRI